MPRARTCVRPNAHVFSCSPRVHVHVYVVHTAPLFDVVGAGEGLTAKTPERQKREKRQENFGGHSGYKIAALGDVKIARWTWNWAVPVTSCAAHCEPPNLLSLFWRSGVLAVKNSGSVAESCAASSSGVGRAVPGTGRAMRCDAGARAPQSQFCSRRAPPSFT